MKWQKANRISFHEWQFATINARVKLNDMSGTCHFVHFVVNFFAAPHTHTFNPKCFWTFVAYFDPRFQPKWNDKINCNTKFLFRLAHSNLHFEQLTLKFIALTKIHSMKFHWNVICNFHFHSPFGHRIIYTSGISYLNEFWCVSCWNWLYLFH